MAIKYPLITEKAALQMDAENKFQFIVDINATKDEIKESVENAYDIEITSVRTMITPKGEKKAVVTLSPDYDADELATRLGIF